MTDLLTHLTDARPTESELASMWPDDDRDALLRRIEGISTTRPSRHRIGATLGLAAAAATAFVVIPVTVDAPSAAAEDLRALALTAASYDGPVLEQGAWLHERTTSVQRNDPSLGETEVLERTRETWTRWDGRTLLVEQDPLAGWTSYDVVDGSRAISDPEAPALDDPASYQEPTPQLAATLPNSAEGLVSYLEDRVVGSSSHDEALYAALVSLATSHTLPPATLAATFEALATVEGVSTGDVRVEGRPAVEVRFDDDVTGTTETMVVDEATGQVLSTRTVSSLRTYSSVTTLSQVVPEVPAAVLDTFSRHDEGVRYDRNGEQLPD
jgi:hypothetical protein